MQESTLQRVIRIIAATQHYPPDKAAELNEDSTFAELGIDSLDGINIVFALEEEFNTNIPDDEARHIKGVRDIVNGIDKLLAAKASQQVSQQDLA
ncbi:MAG: acyl carrier protein [Acidobacteria bacterium]|nr:acyl carrier protein [Acidobacteriota bacterium]